MEKKNFHITKDIFKDRFIYRLSIPEKIKYELTSSNEIEEIYVPRILLGMEIEIPKKKVVYDNNTGSYIDYKIAITIFKESYIKNNTCVIEDISKFEETHNKAYDLLISTLN